MTELSYLIDLLLHHDLKPETKESLAQRIRDVESRLTLPVVTQGYAQISHTTGRTVVAAAEPVAVVAQTPAAQAAIASREQAIAEAMAGKVNKEGGKKRF